MNCPDSNTYLLGLGVRIGALVDGNSPISLTGFSVVSIGFCVGLCVGCCVGCCVGF